MIKHQMEILKNFKIEVPQKLQLIVYVVFGLSGYERPWNFHLIL